MTNHSSSIPDQTRHLVLLWWAGLLVIVGLSVWLRFTGADFGLRSIGGSHAQGYSPLFVWTLALEQIRAA